MTVKSRDRLALGALLPAAIGVMVVAAGWWVAIVSLVAADRRYIGGSLGNSGLGLTLGYNSFGRLTGDETGSVGGGANGGTWGATGLTRLVDGEIGGQIAWLVPAASAAGAAATAGGLGQSMGSRWAAALGAGDRVVGGGELHR